MKWHITLEIDADPIAADASTIAEDVRQALDHYNLGAAKITSVQRGFELPPNVSGIEIMRKENLLPPRDDWKTANPIPANPTEPSLTIARVQLINSFRAQRWHGELSIWSGLEWCGAMCGEAGEAANIAKKLLRWEQGLRGNREAENNPETLIVNLGTELADTVLYAMLAASRYRIDLENCIRTKFNETSIQQGFPERL